mmetsp:Transcript_15615/g.34510  ORF Transcript_15615/g.34510 Transcript_15615/m.34510 type:complete len:84 (+) Transcript_15615:163-414(+)|eukprot:CAMPEP_0173209508 /NCGR_PEP_ID=MMETSP1141-20130122/23132_1 /TAXON_ID=483371 /ORGANISM="non described non described, Strain CCMP2298" /LENGTH=83 /DNA_ID=CAMNT_0014136121 /DNA_START=162 /DNA_END=413 /DNA_ORIENTATION=+
MGTCCASLCSSKDTIDDAYVKLTPEEVARRREVQEKAVLDRQKDFKQGGGGDKLKAKAKALEGAEKKNRDMGGPSTMNPAVYD